MKRIASINMTTQGSTGNIMLQIAELANEMQMDVRTFSAVCYKKPKEVKINKTKHIYFGTYFENMIHTILAKTTGLNGCFSYFGTKELIRKLDDFQPDMIHLHNLHQFCINLPMLFRYIKNKKLKVVWTLHDCWAFTGHCPHFLIAGCEKWKEECYECPQYKKYPKTYVDCSKMMHRLKKKWYGKLENLTIITPSEWLAGMVQQSFLKNHQIQVIHNGIDLQFFKPTESDFRQKYHCEDKKIVLGVSAGWGYSKGLDIFVELANRLDKTYQVVLVGTNDTVDSIIPENILSIHRTEDKRELAEIYSSADVFVNPTREDTFPTVNIEALACGTPVVTFDTGGSSEIVTESCGRKISCDDIDRLWKEIENICTQKAIAKEDCINRAEMYDSKRIFRNYVDLYKRILKN